MKKIKVLIIDDSALIRKLLTEIISSDPRIEVVGSAADPLIAREKIKLLKPDVLTLDVEMPKMDGLTFLANLMRLYPLPVVMVSTLTEHGNEVTLDALELGAIDFVTKPKMDVTHTMSDYKDELIEKIVIASKANISGKNAQTTTNKSTSSMKNRSSQNKHFKTTDQIIAIGASTGGTEAIKEILVDLPADCPGIVISQHIPPGFSRTFAKRMDSVSRLKVYEAEDGQQILPGHAYIAPGDKHLTVVRNGAKFLVKLDDRPRVNRHKPSVEVMFNSVAENVGQNAVGIILTGMGNDGAVGLKNMHSKGAATIAQDEATSVVWGMPAEAVKAGAVDQVLPLQTISSSLMSFSNAA